MKVACVSTVIRARLNEVFYNSISSIKNQDYKNFDIFICYSEEPFWLDDGIITPPKIDGVTFIKMDNTACMRFFEYSLVELIDYDYVVIFGSDCIFPTDFLRIMISYATKDKVYGIIGKEIIPYGWNGVASNGNPINVDLLSSIGMIFNPKLLLDAGILNWELECPLAAMDDETWVNGCLARNGVDRVMIPYKCSSIQVEKGNPFSVCTYSNNIARAPSVGLGFYFRDYWEGFKNANSVR